MSSPITPRRPASPLSVSDTSSITSSSSSYSSATHALIYTRDELLALATSPLSQSATPAQLHAFPEIVRRTRRGAVEAFQALEYARSTGVTPDSPRRSSTALGTDRYNPSGSPDQTTVPVWYTGVYVPPARRVSASTEQRKRVGRDSKMRTWKRMGPVQTRW